MHVTTPEIDISRFPGFLQRRIAAYIYLYRRPGSRDISMSGILPESHVYYVAHITNICRSLGFVFQVPHISSYWFDIHTYMPSMVDLDFPELKSLTGYETLG
jgi:hypothetical protein